MSAAIAVRWAREIGPCSTFCTGVQATGHYECPNLRHCCASVRETERCGRGRAGLGGARIL